MNPHGIGTSAVRRCLVVLAFAAPGGALNAAEEPTAPARESSRQIEEVVVTAEKREATVSDTSISITAFTGDAIEEFGMQGADDLVQYTPATTRDAYDIRIRGVGRNFRSLGGDPGVATYYNGVYSEDFGIAASENALYDVERIEVLRGPQGTLYGRNAIGGALNYISKRPTSELSGEGRVQFGDFDTREAYGYVSGPLIDDVLTARFTGVDRKRDGSQEGVRDDNVNSINDQNYALSFEYTPREDLDFYLRWNDRSSDREIGTDVLLNEGPTGARNARDLTHYARGLRPLATGPLTFVDPVTQVAVNADFVRPGLDVAASIHPNPAYNDPTAVLVNPSDPTDLDEAEADFNNVNPGQHETFDQNAVSFEVNYEYNDSLAFRYIFGYSDFDYTYDLDVDAAPGDFSDTRYNVLEDVYTWSHELQLLWNVGEKLTGTTGIYSFYSNRRQDFGITNAAAQGRFTNAVSYGLLVPWVAFAGPHKRKDTVGDGNQAIGLWQGDANPGCTGDAYACDTGSVFDYQADTRNQSYAAFTQVEYAFSEQWALTLGIRYAQDEKDGFEDITLYFEDNADTGFTGFIKPSLCPVYGLCVGPDTGLTYLAAYNVMMGNATLNYNPADPTTFNPANPITPTCALQDASCATPLRLQGIPFSLARMNSGTEQYDDLTWRVNVDWTPTDDRLVYASVTTGYRAGGYSLGVVDFVGGGLGLPEPDNYKEETVIAYEVGYKDAFLDRKLQIFASIYRYDYDDYQDRLDVYNPARGRTIDVVENAPSALNQGIEIEGTWLALDHLTIGGNYSYTDTEYSEDYEVVALDDPSRPVGILGNAATNPAAFIYNVDGNPLKRIPEHKGVLWATYSLPTDVGDFELFGSWAYTGEYNTNAIERDLEEVPDRQRVDVALTYTTTDERIVARAFCDNVFDDPQLNEVSSSPISDNYYQRGTVLYPRYYGIDVTYRFGAL